MDYMELEETRDYLEQMVFGAKCYVEDAAHIAHIAEDLLREENEEFWEKVENISENIESAEDMLQTAREMVIALQRARSE